MTRSNPREPFNPYGSEPARERPLYITVMLRPDAAAAVREVMKQHSLSKSGAVHHLVRLGAGLPPLPPISTTSTHGH